MPERRRPSLFVLTPVAILVALAGSASAQTAANVAVVINESSPASIEIGQHYARARSVPDGNIIRIKTSVDETVTRAAYTDTIEGAVGAALLERGLVDRVLYVVLTKGVPLKIAGTAGANSIGGSVDSELTLLYRRLTGQTVPFVGQVANPYFAGAEPVARAQRFNRKAYDLYLVTRLDGFSVADVKALIDRAQAPATEGRFRLDPRGDAPAKIPDGWLTDTVTRLEALGQSGRVEIVEKGSAAGGGPVLGYASWGASDPDNRKRQLGIRFAAGALATTFAGTDARTFAAPPAGWEPGPDRPRSAWFADAPQSLIGDLVAQGVTGVAGNVADPLLAGLVRPEILFPAYLSGFNLAEAFYLALPSLSWQGVIVGDPLCKPFTGQELAAAAIDGGVEPATGLPGYFAQRRMAAVRARSAAIPETAVPLIVRAEMALLLGRKDAARAAFEASTAAAPNLADQHLPLAMLYEEIGAYDKAMEQYRRVIAIEPASVVAHNNLAFRLASDPARLTEAMSHARRAVALAPQNPLIIDTLAWVHYLQGEYVEAERLITAAVRMAPASAELRLHAALVAFARDAYTVSESHLTEALRLDPALESKPEVRDLKAKLQKRRR